MKCNSLQNLEYLLVRRIFRNTQVVIIPTTFSRLTWFINLDTLHVTYPAVVRPFHVDVPSVIAGTEVVMSPIKVAASFVGSDAGG